MEAVEDSTRAQSCACHGRTLPRECVNSASSVPGGLSRNFLDLFGIYFLTYLTYSWLYSILFVHVRSGSGSRFIRVILVTSLVTSDEFQTAHQFQIFCQSSRWLLDARCALEDGWSGNSNCSTYAHSLHPLAPCVQRMDSIWTCEVQPSEAHFVEPRMLGTLWSTVTY